MLVRYKSYLNNIVPAAENTPLRGIMKGQITMKKYDRKVYPDTVKTPKVKCVVEETDVNNFTMLGMAFRAYEAQGMRKQTREMLYSVTASKTFEEALHRLFQYADFVPKSGDL